MFRKRAGRKTNEPNSKRRLHVRLDEQLHEFLCDYADSRFTTMSGVIVGLVAQLKDRVERQASGGPAHQW